MKKIVVYSSNNCANCKLAKVHLTQNGFTYEEKNISENIEFKKELISKGFMGVPVIEIDGESIVGFDVSKLDTLLNK